ncbi:DNA damage-inducible protein 1-like [Cryptosporidium felis]|nr:DNA damage-inducible protein 1-like [Cryptosporidium felis]
MKVKVLNNLTGEFVSLEIHEETTVEVLKSLVEIEFNLDNTKSYNLSIEGRNLNNEELVLPNIKNKNSALVVSESNSPNIRDNLAASSDLSNNLVQTFATQIFNRVKKDQSLKLLYYSRSNEYRDAIDGNDLESFTNLLKRDFFSRTSGSTSSSNPPNFMNLDPLSPEYQMIIEEQLRKRNIDESLSLAQDHIPESFAQVNMLYINAEVNGILIKAFVDSGAQMTIMSKKCAEKCNLVRLIDYRFNGIAQGVGTGKIVGRIHVAQMKIGKSFFPFSITVLEEDRVDFLFGLDLLKRFRCCIDLKQNCLLIGDEKVKFLSEVEINELDISKELPDIQDQYLDREIKLQLMSLGFSENQVINALKVTNGDAELAASLLFSNRDF